MTAWLLLILTAGSAYLTYDAFRWNGAIKHAPFSAIASMWKGGLSHLSAVEQIQLKQRYASRLIGAGQLCCLFLAFTAILAYFTVLEFLA